MEIIYTLAGLILLGCTGILIWINWKILRVSEDLLVVSKILLDETIIIRKKIEPDVPSTPIQVIKGFPDLRKLKK